MRKSDQNIREILNKKLTLNGQPLLERLPSEIEAWVCRNYKKQKDSNGDDLVIATLVLFLFDRGLFDCIVYPEKNILVNGIHMPDKEK